MMANDFRARLAITQERLASWLGLNRTSLALAESGRRPMPLGFGVQYSRLTLAAHGLVLGAGGTSAPAPPPLPPPAPDPAPIVARLDYCRHHARNQRYALARMRERAIPYETRLAALAALRAYAGPVSNPAREENWLALFEAEAVAELADHCGAGPQRLLEARIAGLEHEAELLEEMLPPVPPVG